MRKKTHAYTYSLNKFCKIPKLFSGESCQTNDEACNANEVCESVDGDFTCVCPQGYIVVDENCVGESHQRLIQDNEIFDRRY